MRIGRSHPGRIPDQTRGPGAGSAVQAGRSVLHERLRRRRPTGRRSWRRRPRRPCRIGRHARLGVRDGEDPASGRPGSTGGASPSCSLRSSLVTTTSAMVRSAW